MALRTKKRTNQDKVSLEMTPMIDVVFQLLIFFIVTLKQEDINAFTDAMRPQPDPNPQPVVTEPTTILIGPDVRTGRDVLVLNGAPFTEKQLEDRLKRFARMDANTTIIIKCDERSLHGSLVKVLDICTKVGLRQLAVFSM
ncbi:MAG: biopolymer transporter ExbD [Kiritimatiellaeota bacterium]|nr:biopolymer transporter ExbD [Kiritimatiellota bacterium]